MLRSLSLILEYVKTHQAGCSQWVAHHSAAPWQLNVVIQVSADSHRAHLLKVGWVDAKHEEYHAQSYLTNTCTEGDERHCLCCLKSTPLNLGLSNGIWFALLLLHLIHSRCAQAQLLFG